MAWGSSKAAIAMQTRDDKTDNAFSRQGFWLAQEMGSGQPPVEAIEAKMLGEPVIEFISALRDEG